MKLAYIHIDLSFFSLLKTLREFLVKGGGRNGVYVFFQIVEKI